jgi:hypothetical protein
MHFAFSHLRTVLKAVLGISLLAAGSLYSANLVHQKGLNPFAAALVERVATGSVKAARVE